MRRSATVRGLVLSFMAALLAPVAAASAQPADQTATPLPCFGTGSDGKRVQVLYVRSAGAPSNLTALRTVLLATVRHIDNVLDASAAETGNRSQHVRWVTTALAGGGCEPTIQEVQLSSATADDSFANFRTDLESQGFNAATRKYLAFFDGDWTGTCGISQSPTGDTSPDPATNTNNSTTGIASVDRSAFDSVRCAAHELMHVLGAVQAGAPNGSGGHTTDGYDAMSATVNDPNKCASPHTYRYDCGHDDYYSAGDPPAGNYLAANWNTANSGFLSPRTALQTANAPANDAFANAQVLSGPRGAVLTADNIGATQESGEPDHGGVVTDKSVWYGWTAPATAKMIFEIYNEPRTDFHPAMAVYTGGAANSLGTAVAQGASLDTYPTFTVRLLFQATAGTTYRIAVDGTNGAYGSFSFYWNYVPLFGNVDFDGSGSTDISVFRPSAGAWLIRNQNSAFLGASGDIPAPCDYDGDGRTDPAVFRPSVGGWYVIGREPVFFGLNGDIPVPADFTGDGRCDLAVFRPSVGGWYVQGFQTPTFFGLNGDIPVPGDYDANGTFDVAVFRPSVGGWYVSGRATQFLGASGDIPQPGDYDANGTTDVAVYRPSTGAWYVGNQAPVFFGTTGDKPIPLPSAIRQAFFP